MKPYITYDEFKKLDMRIGTIRFLEPVEGADKLLRCEIDFGPVIGDSGAEQITAEEIESGDESAEVVHEVVADDKAPFGKEAYRGRDVRQIVSGIREFFPDYEQLIGKQVLYIVNLEPRTIRGIESHGMLMAVDGMDGAPVFLTPEVPVEAGSSVR
ncbi:MAG: hypothetical protein LRY41_00690 [Candidatus Pacebacteria bacterium]|nr:hypothetical protein [Candidatus Paceibacterota bacterium]MCD8507840.1 hypothetical protein [Candidatus Paceibacterota bacterium]MCD8527843.1 hypothetical protein [Candidatus Paceibacterota bacterium]MCD8563519.1 hypothetical protein [Candidatus Paceibacterota bacterium]